MSLEQRPSQYRLLSVRGLLAGLRPRGLNRGHRFRRAMAPRPAPDHSGGRGGRDAGEPGRQCSPRLLCSAFSGLFAPYWRSDARGVIVGLSRFHTRAHIARALEAICYQSRDVVEAMEKDAGVQLDELKVDGGVTANTLCMQIQADTLGVEVSKPVVPETTALGAAYAAGVATGFWASPDELRENWLEDKRWLPQISERRAAGYEGWKKAVERTLDWVQVE